MSDLIELLVSKEPFLHAVLGHDVPDLLMVAKDRAFIQQPVADKRETQGDQKSCAIRP
jgi:hypothetical protein